MKFLVSLCILTSTFSFASAEQSSSAWLADLAKSLDLPLTEGITTQIGPTKVNCYFWETGEKFCSFSWQGAERTNEKQLKSAAGLDHFLEILSSAGVVFPKLDQENSFARLDLEDFQCSRVNEHRGRKKWNCSIRQKFKL